MSASPIPECPEVDGLVTSDLAVHLLLRINGDWDAGRADTTAELERKTQAAVAFAASSAFRDRFGARIGVVRVQSAAEAPSIVAHLLTEQGIELEVLGGEAPADGPTCSFCGRERLRTEQAAMTDSGWACPSCFRAWNVKTQPQLLEKPRRLRIPPRLFWPLLGLLIALFLLGTYYELQRLNKMNLIIRQHLPTE
jgi:hypothetical protein